MGLKRITDEKKILSIDRVDYSMVGGKNSFRSIKQQIAAQKYNEYFRTVTGHKNTMLEDDRNHGLPPMDKVFYGFYGLNGCIPSWTFFMELYCKFHVIPNPQNPNLLTFLDKNPKFHYSFDKPCLERRLLNAYMSFCKEQYIQHWLYDAGYESAYWSASGDLELGLDIQLQNHQGKNYGIKVFADTPEAKRQARDKADTRHVSAASLGIGVFVIPVVRDESHMIGDTYVPSDAILRCMCNLMSLGADPVGFIEHDSGYVEMIPEMTLREAK